MAADDEPQHESERGADDGRPDGAVREPVASAHGERGDVAADIEPDDGSTDEQGADDGEPDHEVWAVV